MYLRRDQLHIKYQSSTAVICNFVTNITIQVYGLRQQNLDANVGVDAQYEPQGVVSAPLVVSRLHIFRIIYDTNDLWILPVFFHFK